MPIITQFHNTQHFWYYYSYTTLIPPQHGLDTYLERDASADKAGPNPHVYYYY